MRIQTSGFDICDSNSIRNHPRFGYGHPYPVQHVLVSLYWISIVYNKNLPFKWFFVGGALSHSKYVTLEEGYKIDNYHLNSKILVSKTVFLI